MDIIQRIQYLKERHKTVDKQIEEGYSKYLNDGQLSLMKREKLHIKDELTKLEKEYEQRLV